VTATGEGQQKTELRLQTRVMNVRRGNVAKMLVCHHDNGDESCVCVCECVEECGSSRLKWMRRKNPKLDQMIENGKEKCGGGSWRTEGQDEPHQASEPLSSGRTAQVRVRAYS
jgi:hypothetical protein